MKPGKTRKLGTYIIAALFVAIPLALFIYTFITGGNDDASEQVGATPTPVIMQTPDTDHVSPAPSGSLTSDPSAPAPTLEPYDSTSTPAIQTTPNTPNYTVSNINDTDTDLTALLNGLAPNYYCAAVSIAAYDSERGFRTYQYGKADIADGTTVTEDTLFRVASLSKLVVAILAMSLVDEGELDLDEDISTYLGYEVKNPYSTGTPITCRMLMQHTATISDYGNYQSGDLAFYAGTLKTLLNTTSTFTGSTPGTRSEYSNLGYVVLAAVCENISGKMLDELANDVLFTPMGIDAAFAPYYLKDKVIASQYDIDNNLRQSGKVAPDTPDPADKGFQYNSAPGNLRITPLDYVRIIFMLINDGKYGDVRILSENAVRQMHDADFKVEYNDPQGLAAGNYMQGLCIRYQEDAFKGLNVYWHTGSAYGTFAQLIYEPNSERIAVVVTTGGSGAREENGMVKSCLALSELVW